MSKKIKNAQLTYFPLELEGAGLYRIFVIDIYKIGFFDFKSLIVIKILEKTINRDQEEQTIQLLNEEDIQPYVDKYTYINIGLIQVVYKPLTLKV